MTKKLFLFLLISTVAFLSSCDQGSYTSTGHTLNGNDVYIYDSEQEICAAWYSMGVQIDSETVFHLVNLCPLTYVVKVDGDYVDLYRYIENNDVSREELEKLEYGFFTVTTSIENVLEINLNEYQINSVIVRTPNDENLEPPQWDVTEITNVSIGDISDDVVRILAEPLGEKQVCEEDICRTLYQPSPIEITLVTVDMIEGETTILLEVYEDYLNITKYVDDEFEAVIYHIETPSENIGSLYDTIFQRYQEINE